MWSKCGKVLLLNIFSIFQYILIIYYFRTREIVKKIRSTCGYKSVSKTPVNTTTVLLGTAVAVTSAYAAYYALSRR